MKMYLGLARQTLVIRNFFSENLSGMKNILCMLGFQEIPDWRILDVAAKINIKFKMTQFKQQ